MKWTYEKLLNECLRLRREADEAEVRLMTFLWRIENTPGMLSLIVDAGSTFESFVENDVLVRFSRYKRFADSFVGLGANEEEAVSLGADAVIVSGSVSEDKREDYKRAVSAWSDEHRGARPKRDTAKKIASEIDPRVKVPGAVLRQQELEQLRRENSQLRARVRNLEAENRKLKQEIERFGAKAAKIGGGRGGARKRSSNGTEIQPS